MSALDAKPLKPPEENFPAHSSFDQPEESAPAEPISPLLGGDPLSYMAVAPPAFAPTPNLPEDLRISWSWPHLLVFVVFVVASQFTVAIVVLAYFSADRHLSQKRSEEHTSELQSHLNLV